MVTTIEDCEALAMQLDLSDTKANTTNNFKRPPYCYYMSTKKPHRRLWFNNATIDENKYQCTKNGKCVCKNGVFHKSNLIHLGKIKNDQSN